MKNYEHLISWYCLTKKDVEKKDGGEL